MIKLIIGVKGTGKTKTLINLVNEALDKTEGSVLCIEKGTKLIHEIKYTARLVNTDEYNIMDAADLFGFVAGAIASNQDLTDSCIDSALKICNERIETFTDFVNRIDAFANAHNINVVMTASMPEDKLPASLNQYVIAH